MHRIVFYLFRVGISFFRIIPFMLLYFKSHLAFVIIYYIVGYRRRVVLKNLTYCFPDKSEKELKQLSKLFYKNNLSPIFAEGLKGFTMSQKQFRTRYKVINPEILEPYFNNGQSVIAIASHYGNWEWGVQAVGSQFRHQAAALYKPLSNEFIERYNKKLREKSGIHLVSINDTLDYFKSPKPRPVIYIMAADQYPGGAMDKALWVNFFGHSTPCLHGPESYARYNKLPVFFFDAQRVKQGYYTLEIKLLADNSDELEKGELTQRYMNHLEQSIRNKPENYLWSHKRWKNIKNMYQ